MTATIGNVTTNTSTSATGATFSHNNNASGENQRLAVCVKFRSATSRTVSSVTYNGVGMTRIAGASLLNEYNSGVFHGIDWWELDGPAAGANNVVVTLSGGVNALEVTAFSVSDGGEVDTGANNFASSGSTLSVDVVTSEGDCLIIAGGLMRLGGGGSFTPVSPATELTDGDAGTDNQQGIMYTDLWQVGETADTHTIATTSTLSLQWAMGAIAIRTLATSPDVEVGLDALQVQTSMADVQASTPVSINLDALEVVTSMADLTVDAGVGGNSIVSLLVYLKRKRT